MNEDYEVTKYRVAYCPSGIKHYTIQAYVVFKDEGKKKATKTKTKSKAQLEEPNGVWFGWNKKTCTWEYGTEKPRCYFTKKGAEKARRQIIKLGW